MAKRILRDQEARHALARGVEQVAAAIACTLGPRGRNVIFDRESGAPAVTNDGVTIAREIELTDPFENIGVRMLREASSRTADVAGDGTTTATVLAGGFVREGLRYVTAGVPPIRLKRAIEVAVVAAVQSVQDGSRPIHGRDEIRRVASLSAHEDEQIGELVADAMEMVGPDGIVIVEEGRGLESVLRRAEGLQIASGYVSPYFVSDPSTMECHIDEGYLLITESKLRSVGELVPILEQVAERGRPLTLVAEDFEADALSLLVINRLRGQVATCAIRAPAFGERRREILEDLALLTGATVLSPATGREIASARIEDLGTVRRVEATKERATFLGGGGSTERIDERTAQLRKAIGRESSTTELEHLRERLGRLSGGVAVIEVGAATELALHERRGRLSDALAATRAAVEEGIVPGGGVSLLRAAGAVARLRAEQTDATVIAGCQLVERVLEEPIRYIAENAGIGGSIVIEKLREMDGNYGYDAWRGEYVDLMDAGIVDPTKVVRTALQNAASIGAMVLTAETVVAEAPAAEEESGEES